MQTLQIRNSTVEFLIFTKQNKEKTIEVIVMKNLFGLVKN